ncbi:MAG: DNA/RNA nuclease SfsA [Pikeienuella sp.]
MEFPRPLIPATLIKRYKRFLADVELADGTVVTAHCANPGAMTGLKAAGLKVWLEPNDDPKRKLKFSWKLAEISGDDGSAWVGIDTSLPNKVVGEALAARAVPELAHYSGVRAEVKYGLNSRIDFLLTETGYPDCYVEVKNAHLRRSGRWAEFPDSVTKRGAKHLGEMAEMVRAGARAVTLFLVQRDDCDGFRLAGDIDPAYAAATRMAKDAGVETIVYGTLINTSGVTLGAAMRLGEAFMGDTQPDNLD